ncbi:MAG: hypothetical protein ACKO6K_10275, partial [Chitinophagaceae bacterium]
MQQMKNVFLLGILCGLSCIVKADLYPINKYIDVQHYSFQIQLSDSSNELFGETLITILFRKSGL